MRYVLIVLLCITAALVGCGKKEPAKQVTFEPPINLSNILEQAAIDKKNVLLDFTGSDWCPPCKELQANVLSKPDFLDYAKSNLVVVEVDFPYDKPQSEAQKATNSILHDQFLIEQFPTLVLLNSEGKKIWSDESNLPKNPSELISRIEQARRINAAK